MDTPIKSGFSLIELSIVLLIIGLIVASVFGGNKVISISRLSSARSLTSSSPVNGIEGLTLWLETTSKDSLIKAEAIDGTAISTWYDINPQSTSKMAFTQATVARRPAYSGTELNGLPALAFNSSYMASTSNIAASRITAANGDITVFVVAKDSDTGGAIFNGFVFFWPGGGANRLGFDFSYPTLFFNSGTCCTRASVSITPYVGQWIILSGVRGSG